MGRLLRGTYVLMVCLLVYAAVTIGALVLLLLVASYFITPGEGFWDAVPYFLPASFLGFLAAASVHYDIT